MIDIIYTTDSSEIELEEYIQLIQDKVNLQDTECILDSSKYLKRLANNKTFFSQFLNQELKCIESFQVDNGYSPQSFMLYRGKGFAIRLNIWPPKHEIKDQRLFSYDLPHDHNFDFMTIGFTGSGYESDLWDYDSSKVDGVPGESVLLNYNGRVKLTSESIHLYHKGVDIHTQYPPKSFSTSINLMIAKDIPTDTQYIFNTQNSCIRYPIIRIGSATSRAVLLRAASVLGDINTLDILEETEKRHPCTTTRQMAKRSKEILEVQISS